VLRAVFVGIGLRFQRDAALFTIVCTDPESQNMFVMPGDNVKRKPAGWLVILCEGLIFIFSMGRGDSRPTSRTIV